MLGAKVNVAWLSLHEPTIKARGYWDQAWLEQFLWRYQTSNFEGGLPSLEGGAILVIPARWHIEDGDVEQINQWASALPWVFFILTGDEEGVFPWRALEHPNSKVWVQTPSPSKHKGVDGVIGDWTPPNCTNLVDQPPSRRLLTWAFSGQINNTAREQCHAVLRERMTQRGDGFLRVTKIFGSGLDYPTYMNVLKDAKLAPCPGGTFTPDTFRLYEALEAGCIPIIDPGPRPEENYWDFVFRVHPVPVPMISEWSQFDEMADRILDDYPNLSAEIALWWPMEKKATQQQFDWDLRELVEHG